LIFCILPNPLHGNEYKLEDEEDCDDGDDDVLLGVLAGEEGDQGIGNGADTDTVGNGVGQRHHNQSKECGNRRPHINHINLHDVLAHQNADEDQSGSSRASGNDGSQRGQDQAESEADRSHNTGQTGPATGSNTGRGLNEGCAGGGSEDTAADGSDGVAEHALINVDGVIVLVDEAGLRGSTVKGAQSIEHIDQAENDNQDHSIDDHAGIRKAAKGMEPGISREQTGNTDGTEILEGSANLREVEVGESPGGQIVQNSHRNDGDDDAALDILLVENADQDKADKGQHNRSDRSPGFHGAGSRGQGAVEIKELNKGILVGLDQTDVLEADEGNEQSDSGGNRLLQAVRQSLSHCLANTGSRKDQEENTFQQNDHTTGLVTQNGVSFCALQHLGQNESDEEE